MKYEIVKKDTDVFELKYKDKVFEFKTTVGIISKMQSSIKRARVQMVQDLAKEGLSIKQLTVETKKDGKIYYDNSNKEEIEKAYTEGAVQDIIDEICLEYFENTFTDLILDIDFDTEEESTKFSNELINILTGRTPRGRN